MSQFVLIGDLVRRGDYEVAEKTCPKCGRYYRGHVWTKPIAQSAQLRRVFVFQGRVLGWCEPCITAEEIRQRKQEEAMLRERERRIKPKRAKELKPPDMVREYPV